MPTAVAPMKPLEASSLNAATSGFVKGASTAPSALMPMTIAVIQKPM
jgi:hypothetical protein